MANEYLKRTPTSTGNRRVFTWSGWVKKNEIDTGFGRLFEVGANTSNRSYFTFRDGDELEFVHRDSGSITDQLISDYEFKDPGSFAHFMIAANSTASSTGNRIKIYVNGVLLTGYSTSNLPSANQEFDVNSLVGHYLGNSVNQAADLMGSMSDVFFIDGQALTPDVFGFYKDGKGYQSSGSTQATDFRPGQWSPHSPRKIKSEIERRGGFGVNGFYLPMNDSSNVGADFHCTPNSIIKLKGEDLPQPRNGAPTTSDAYVSQLRQEEGSLGFDGVIKFDGSGDYLSLADNADCSFDGDFTIEAFVYPTAFNSFNTIFSTENLDFKFISSGAVRIYTSGGSNTTGTISLNRWSHIAVVRQGSTFKVYINGNGETVTPPAFTGDGSSAAEIGRKIRNTSEELTGFISNLRVVKGTAVYTSNFTAPTEPLANITNTKLLCCNSSTSATTATVKPGSITANGGAFATRNELSGSIVLAVPGIATGNGSNLITNGSFDTDISGWSSGNSSTLTHEFAGPNGNGSIKVASGTGSNGYAYTNLTGATTVGQRYTLSFDYQHVSGPQGYVNVGNSTGASQVIYQNLGTSSSWKRYTFSFTATVTNQFIGFYSRYSSGVTRFANISLVQQDAPRDYSADIKGSGTNKTPTLSGRSGVGYDFGGYYGSAYTSSSNDDSLEFPGTSGDFNVGTGDFTIEMWLNPDSTQATNARLFGQDGNSAGNWDVYIKLTSASNQINMMGGAESLTGGDGSSYGNLVGDQWNHFCLERHNGQLTTYVNGVAVYTQSYTSSIGDNNPFRIGQIGSNVYGGITYGFNGEIQDFRFYKGVSKYRGSFDVPKPYTPVGIESWRQVPDTCKNNFPTLNPIHGSTLGTYSNGNLKIANSGVNNIMEFHPTIGMTSGKWYCEVRADNVVGSNRWHFGISSRQLLRGTMNQNGGKPGDITVTSYSDDSYRIISRNYNDVLTQHSSGTGIPNMENGDILGVAVNITTPVDNWVSGDNFGTVQFYRNGSVYGPSITLSRHKLPDGTGGTSGNTPYTREWFFASHTRESSAQTVNYGQNPTFCGQTTAGTYTDSNGKGLFKYQPPSGYLALCEDNLPAPAIADPGKHMKTVLWAGDGSSGRSVTGLGFQPDLVWVKRRDGASVRHYLFDSIRGPLAALDSADTIAEVSSSTWLQSFDSNGFSLGTSGGLNGSGNNYVAWCWKAGGAAVSNIDGTITSQVSANQDAGFSIVSYTGNGSNGTTVGHGLGKTPNIVLVKNRIDSSNWSFNGNIGGLVYGTNKMVLQGTGAIVNDTNEVTSANATTFTVGTSGATNGNSDAQIAYCWTEIEGFSKFGSYIGNGNADGPFVYCGFKPAWVMIKSSTVATNWYIFDNSRKSTNPITAVLFSNTSDADTDNAHDVDFVSNGFKVRQASGYGGNNDGASYLFMAFAESPFQTANAK